MRERPDISDNELISALARHYDLHVTALSFLPIGNDATAWVFRATGADGRNFFLKLKRPPVYAPALTAPRFLVEAGIAAIVAPLVDRNGSLWNAVSGFTLTVYPFVEGPTGMDVGLAPQQWTSLGAILRRVHGYGAQSAGLADMRRESFRPAWLDTVHALQQRIDASTAADDFADDFADPIAADFVADWRARQDEIQRICDRAAALGRLAAARNLPLVLCHTDIHTANVLVDPHGELHIVDWDQPLFAPKERDLMFFVQNGPGESVEPSIRHFFDGYGKTVIDWTALAYYRYEWVVQELGDYGERVLDAQAGDVTRAEAVREFRQLFDPGDVVDGALQGEGWIG